MVTVEYQCADGTPFPVTFEREEDVETAWLLERVHNPGPEKPLAQSVGTLGRDGGHRAYLEAGLIVPSWMQTGPFASGFVYFKPFNLGPEEMVQIGAGTRTLIEKYGSGQGIWTEHCLPRVKEACAWLESAGLDVPIATLAQTQSYAMHLTMVPMLVSGNDIRLLTDVCTPLYGEQAALVANELAQGFPNETLRADEAMWQLARSVRRSGALSAAIDIDDPGAAIERLRADGAEPAFFTALDSFLDQFGGRTETWSIASPTWREQAPGFWAQLRRLTSPSVPSPMASIAAGAARREALVAEIEAKLADDDASLQRFRRRVERVASYVAVREERALWQLVGTGALRAALLRRGTWLTERGSVDRPEDVLYLFAEEAEDEPQDRRALVAERGVEHERVRELVPPLTVGGTAAPVENQPEPRAGEWRGVGGSRGVATGLARVVADLADVDRLQPGDVLVCMMTAPPWTPLFGLASAVVTETGGIGDHPAIAAREYGIPCVLSVANATRSIPDGALVTVDGAAGTVRLEE